jgi:hypothetical protein
VYEKLFNITNHHGNVDQHHDEMSPLQSEWRLSKRLKVTAAGEAVEKRELFALYWWECKLVLPL